MSTKYALLTNILFFKKKSNCHEQSTNSMTETARRLFGSNDGGKGGQGGDTRLVVERFRTLSARTNSMVSSGCLCAGPAGLRVDSWIEFVVS